MSLKSSPQQGDKPLIVEKTPNQQHSVFSDYSDNQTSSEISAINKIIAGVDTSIENLVATAIDNINEDFTGRETLVPEGDYDDSAPTLIRMAPVVSAVPASTDDDEVRVEMGTEEEMDEAAAADLDMEEFLNDSFENLEAAPSRPRNSNPITLDLDGDSLAPQQKKMIPPPPSSSNSTSILPPSSGAPLSLDFSSFVPQLPATQVDPIAPLPTPPAAANLGGLGHIFNVQSVVPENPNQAITLVPSPITIVDPDKLPTGDYTEHAQVVWKFMESPEGGAYTKAKALYDRTRKKADKPVDLSILLEKFMQKHKA